MFCLGLIGTMAPKGKRAAKAKADAGAVEASAKASAKAVEASAKAKSKPRAKPSFPAVEDGVVNEDKPAEEAKIEGDAEEKASTAEEGEEPKKLTRPTRGMCYLFESRFETLDPTVQQSYNDIKSSKLL